MELKTCLRNKYSSRRAHSVRERAGRGSDEALMWCAWSSRQLSWGRSFEQSSSRWLGTSPAARGEEAPMEGLVWVSGAGELPFRITPACKEIMIIWTWVGRTDELQSFR